MRYRVYIWGFPCFDYSFDVLISPIGNVSLYNYFPVVTLLTVSFHVHMCLYSWYISCKHVPVIHATWLYYMYSQGCVWQSWILMSRSYRPDLGDLSVVDQSAQLILPWWSECSRSSGIAVVLPPSFSPVWLSRSLLCSWASLNYYYVYPFMYCTFISSGDVIFL